ncbi:SET and MYND domain-containing protein 4 isoform X2 [Arabidopsis lyrata subsp. lyrata]|uniref:SET and MYND domain-containing protein 4 isoform X2 n=1 Tax=Arabidopsis lyrata subsp. lyrata TaxID=81972 RepID=UPI000A29D83C|nr:SET and MYND domain-containing protein 4 isoform X2 [Arabidopsis lyrata subsp. lyrata]|eukprot:XP_020870414.1 SET and MYND domain-containing protein 4 isoform X2 [Arabidopsis lyrata subsp. lyrata]
MEKLKSLIPEDLLQTVKSSSVDDLLTSTSSLLRLLLGLPQFHQAVSELADPELGCCGKNEETSLDLKRRGNLCFRSRDFVDALRFYSKALRVAPPDAIDGDKSLLASLFLNRANVLHNLGLLKESLRDCHRALRIDPCYAKAWYRRGKLNTLLRNYKDAFRDMEVSMSLESSLLGKKQLQNELKAIPDYQNKQSSEHDEYHSSSYADVDQLPSVQMEVKLRCVSTKEKGRGMVSDCDIEEASVIHVEQPFSVVISKSCRETHCHFCLNGLPADTVPCPSCSIPVYCSESCQIQSVGMLSTNEMEKHLIFQNLPDDIVEHIKGVTSADICYSETDCIQEHQHECRGANWPAVLPSDAVLAGRVIMKLINHGKADTDLSNLQEILELSHSYSKMNSESKLELHLLSIVLIWCLSKSSCPNLSVCEASVSQTIILLSQIKVNSIAVVRMKSSDDSFKCIPSGNVSAKEPIQSLEQIRVGQALYKTGSLFNHSCKPNIHLYFLSRGLVMRTTEFVPMGCPLELSYGPEVGKWDCKNRIRFLEEEYFFHFLDSNVATCESEKLNHFSTAPRNLDQQVQVREVYADVEEVASSLLSKPRGFLHIEPEVCLKCGSHCDIENSHAEVNKAWNHMRRVEELMNTGRANYSVLSDCLRSIAVLRTFLHMYNKDIADAEDKVAQACYLAGELVDARKHCEASIKILKKLYEDEHVVIGNEMVKLASIQLALGDSSGAWDTTKRLSKIFSKYYGSHAETLFSDLPCLKQEAVKAVNLSTS